MTNPIIANFHPRRLSRGFTLAELLISVAILGVIATFTLSKILPRSSNNQKIAIFKESISTLSAVTQKGMMDGVLNQKPNATVYTTYFQANLNALKNCSTNPVTQGCWAATAPGAGSYNYASVLPNGASILYLGAGVDDAATSQNGAGYVYLDYNGLDNPNVEGQDVIILCMGFGPNTFMNDVWSHGIMRPGEVIPCQNHPVSTPLMTAIFQ